MRTTSHLKNAKGSCGAGVERTVSKCGGRGRELNAAYHQRFCQETHGSIPLDNAPVYDAHSSGPSKSRQVPKSAWDSYKW